MGRRIDTSTSRSLEVAEASNRTSDNVATVAEATEHLLRSITEISQQVAQSTEVTSHAVEEANHVTIMIRGLNAAAQKIGAVVKMITDIAGQTNLLALNATIEAARAGDAGKGFAVVAAEVKNLANQTARATEEISGQISGIQAETQIAVDAITAIGKTITGVSKIAATIASAVEEQNVSTDEIVRNVRTLSTDAEAVRTRILDVTRSSAASYGSAIQVLWAARDLDKPTHVLETEVDAFLARVRQK